MGRDAEYHSLKQTTKAMLSGLKLPSGSRGITLVETLVATGILAILLSLSLASYGRVTGALDRSRCMVNLREIGQATLAYAGEHQGSLPGPLGASLQYAFYTPKAQTDPSNLVDFLHPYLGLAVAPAGQEKIAKIMVCPAGLKVVTEQGGSARRGRFYTQISQALFEDPNVKQYPFGYRYTDGRDVQNAHRITRILQPSRIQLLRDAVANSAASKSDSSIPWHQSHGTFYNAVFLDGHVETVPLQ